MNEEKIEKISNRIFGLAFVILIIGAGFMVRNTVSSYQYDSLEDEPIVQAKVVHSTLEKQGEKIPEKIKGTRLKDYSGTISEVVKVFSPEEYVTVLEEDSGVLYVQSKTKKVTDLLNEYSKGYASKDVIEEIRGRVTTPMNKLRDFDEDLTIYFLNPEDSSKALFSVENGEIKQLMMEDI